MRHRTVPRGAAFAAVAALLLSLAACGGDGEPSAAGGEVDYPTKTIKWVVPSDAGGGADTVTRAMTKYLEKELDTEITIVNQAGAGGEIGHTTIFAEGDDGYTLGTLLAPHYAITTVQSKPPYGLDDFAWFNAESSAPGVMVVLKDSPYQTFKDVTDAAAAGQEVVVGVSALNDHHLLLLYLKDKLASNFRIVPYAGGGEGRAALLGKHVDVYFAPATAQEGIGEQARAIAVAGDTALPAWPGATTLREQFGQADLPLVGTIVGYGSTTKFKTEHPEEWQKVSDALKRVWDNPEYQAELEKLGRKPYSQWRGPEASQALVGSGLEFVREHGALFNAG
jgi:putative tricarboxylic transport membrane protein